MWLALFTVFAGSYAVFLTYLKLQAGRPWNLRTDDGYSPRVTVLVPAHNEELEIERKLENLATTSYPKGKLEVIMIDDGSTDQTSAKALDFAKNHPEFPLRILRQDPRKGKASALNKALHVSSNDIVIVTDSDTVWPQNTLSKALRYMADPKIGAVTGLGVIGNPNESWAAGVESKYLNIMSMIRLGESKVHSTIRFEGALCAFRRNAFNEFDTASGADDSGAALQVVQNNFRAILAPEAYALAKADNTLRKRTNVKLRRALHLNGLYFQCFKLLCTGHLVLPKKIALPGIFIHIINPFVFVALVCTTTALMVYYPIVLFVLISALGVISLIPKTRGLLWQGMFDQFILFYSVVLHLRKRRVVAWDK